MKMLKLLAFVIIAGLPSFLSALAWADDVKEAHEKGEKHGESSGSRGGAPVAHAPGGGPRVSPAAASASVVRVPQAVTPSTSSGRVVGTQSGPRVPTVSSGMQTQRVRSGVNASNRVGSNPAYSAYRFNQSNQYGGRWYPQDTHPNWSTDRLYHWNNHTYCWYDGGWLVVDGGFWPYGVPYPFWYNPDRIYPSGYFTNTAAVVNVQATLANLGYYNGAADGVFGPMTSAAISSYQVDNGLPVTGRISPSLLESLGLNQ